MNEKTPFWQAQLMQAEREREHMRKRLYAMREDLEEALDWVEAGESVLIPMLRMHGVETAPLVHFDMLVSEVHRTGLIERLDNERWRTVDGEEMPPSGERIRVWGGVEVSIVWFAGRRSFESFSMWAEFRGFTHWRPKAQGPGGEE